MKESSNSEYDKCSIDFLKICGSGLLGPGCSGCLLQIGMVLPEGSLSLILWVQQGLEPGTLGLAMGQGTTALGGFSAKLGQPHEAQACPLASPLDPSGA